MIYNITTDDLKGMTANEGLVFQGCGGEPGQWLQGINEMLTQAGILLNNNEFVDISVFKHKGLTNILFDFNSIEPGSLDMGKLAIWRLQNREKLDAVWLSDYLVNELGVDLYNSQSPSGAEDRQNGDIGINYTKDTPAQPFRIYIEKWNAPHTGGFTMPLPASPDSLRPLLEDIEVSEWQDILISDIRSDIKGLGDRLKEIIAQEDMSPYRLNELNYLAARIEGLSESSLEIFAANIEAGRNCDSIAGIINLTYDENLSYFSIEPVFSEEMYGKIHLEMLSKEKHADAFVRLTESYDLSYRELAAYIDTLEKHIDKKALGRTIIESEGGVITGRGYLTGGGGIREIYRDAYDIPTQYHIYSPPLPVVENVELSSLLLKMHAVGGEFMQRANKNFNTLINRQKDELFLLIDGKGIHLMDTTRAYFAGSYEHKKWEDTELSPQTRAFVVMADDNGDKFAIGSLIEIDFAAQKRDILENSIHYDQVELVNKDGTEQLISREAWEGLSAADKKDTVSWRHIYNKSACSVIATHMEEQCSRYEANNKVVSAEDFLADINSSYMNRAENPQPGMLRITREAAAEALARGDADVYRLFPGSYEQMWAIDAIKNKGLWYTNNREFAIKREGIGGLDKWAERKAGDFMRLSDRGERTRSNHKTEEL